MPAKSTTQLTNELIKATISLEKKSVDLMTAVNTLTKKVDSLISIFQDAADYLKKGKTIEEPLVAKLNELLEQNKNIARGLILLEKYVRDKSVLGSQYQPKPLTKF